MIRAVITAILLSVLPHMIPVERFEQFLNGKRHVFERLPDGEWRLRR